MENQSFCQRDEEKTRHEAGKIIWKVLVVHDRKYHLFLAPSAGRGKVGGERKRVQPLYNNSRFYFLFGTGYIAAPIETSAAHSQINCKLRAPGITALGLVAVVEMSGPLTGGGGLKGPNFKIS